MKRLAIYCGSASPENPRYEELAMEIGEALARRGIGVVYGGGKLGLMGAVSAGALLAGGEVIGVIPDLSDRIVTKFHYAPRDFALDFSAHLGSAFSLEPILSQSAWFRGHNRDDVLSNLYLVGAGTHPGAGIPGVVASAKATAGLMLQDLKR